MMYIIIGLGRYGSATAIHLTSIGHEVIGVDADLQRVEEYKQAITDTICLNSTEESALKNLPIKDAEAILVSLGENVGDSIITTAILKKLNSKKLYVRSLSPVHETVLNSIGVDKVITPEKESALSFATSLQYGDALNSSMLHKEYNILDLTVPSSFVGQTLKNIAIKETFNLQPVALRTQTIVQNLIGKETIKPEIVYSPDENTVIQETDSLILMGLLQDFKKIRLLYD